MGALIRFFAIVGADLRERTRTHRFWIMLALVLVASWYCFPGDDASYVIFSTDGERGFYSSAWIGLGMSLVLSFMLGLVGFYLVRGTLVRDFETRVWQLLVATPMTRAGFLLAKWLSHMAVFLVISTLALAVGVLAQWWRGEDATIDLLELVKPVLVISVPSLAISAMFAIWFDLLPWLRRTAGNVLFFFLWITLVATALAPLEDAGPEALQNWRSDAAGMSLVARDLSRVRSEQLGHDVGFGFNLGAPRAEAGVVRFDWRQWQPRPMDLLGRLLWVLAAIVGVLAAAPWLDWAAARSEGAQARKDRHSGRMLRGLDWLMRPLELSALGTVVAAELKLALRQRRWWWWLACAGVMVACVLAPGEMQTTWLVVAWVLVLDVVARGALRERDSGTGALVFSAAGVLWRLLLARLLLGLVFALGVVAPGLIRMLLAHDPAAWAVLAVSMAMVLWGLALGVLCRNPRPFELLVLLIGYLGIQGAPVLAITQAPAATAMGYLLACLPAAAIVISGWPRVARA